MRTALVVGSGASGVHAAWRLLQRGFRVRLLDVGERDHRYASLIRFAPFEELRRTDPMQDRYFLGDDLEGVPTGPVRVGAQLTPPRQHLTRGAAEHLPLHAPEFQAMQSLALGGLAAGWGAAVPPYTDADLAGWPIDRADLQPHYDAVARRIGICGTADDDLARFYGPSPYLLPPASQDSNGRFLHKCARHHRAALRREGTYIGHPRLALVTRQFKGRGPAALLDMDFWSDSDQSVYRPRWTLEELQRHASFAYVDRFLVREFHEDSQGVRVDGLDLSTDSRRSERGDVLVLAAGTLGTARIALRSLHAWGRPVPLVANPYTYYPSLVWRRLGEPSRSRRHSLTQLMLYHDPEGDASRVLQGQVYSYRSLLTFKLVKESPLAVKESIGLMRLLMDYFIILGVHHEDRPSLRKQVRLLRARDGEGEPILHVEYRPTAAELAERQEREEGLLRALRRLGCLPLRRILPGEGASIHYGGCLPMQRSEAPCTTTPDGLLRGTRAVYVADGAAFPHLPAKGLTYTLMANADRVAARIPSG